MIAGKYRCQYVLEQGGGRMKRACLLLKGLIGAVVISLLWSNVSLPAGSARGKIEAGKPRYVRKNHEAWKYRGRIVGIAKEAPEFKLTLLKSKRVVKKGKSEAEEEGKRAYELEWLRPGTYTLRISADGYKTLELKKLKVKAGYDLRIDLEFTEGKE